MSEFNSLDSFSNEDSQEIHDKFIEELNMLRLGVAEARDRAEISVAFACVVLRRVNLRIEYILKEFCETDDK